MKTQTKKQKLGQFYTKQYDYILQNLHIPKDVMCIIEPFAGDGELVKFIQTETSPDCLLLCYDIDPKQDYIIKQDTLIYPPDYTNKYVITNPPFLARNKAEDKTIFDKYEINDFYKCFLKSLINTPCVGGIIILPINFWCSIRKNDVLMRRDFINTYTILRMNIFEERVFEDTPTTVCSFQFKLKLKNTIQTQPIEVFIFPTKEKLLLSIENMNIHNNFMFGGDIYNLPNKGRYKVSRLTSKNITSIMKENITNILVKCIDDCENSKLGLKYIENEEEIYIDETPNQSARTYATLVVIPSIDKDIQKIIVENFNIFLNEERKKYNSLFLTNYRESKDIARKRISFDLVYSVVIYLLENM